MQKISTLEKRSFWTVPTANTGGNHEQKWTTRLMEEGMGKRLSRREFLQAAAGAPWAGAVTLCARSGALPPVRGPLSGHPLPVLETGTPVTLAGVGAQRQARWVRGHRSDSSEGRTCDASTRRGRSPQRCRGDTRRRLGGPHDYYGACEQPRLYRRAHPNYGSQALHSFFEAG